jgi:hypothetical protein
MSKFVPDLPASAVDARLRAAVAELRRAEQSAVLGLSDAKTYQFIRLAESLARLPALRASVEAGELPWTWARSVAAVATPLSLPAPKVQVSLSLEPAQHARLQGMLEHLRKQGRGESREQRLLAAFAVLAEAECARVHSAPPNRVVLCRCAALRRRAPARRPAPGSRCRATRFLEVHHRRPRERGGANDAANLITLCGACHRLLHAGARYSRRPCRRRVD